MKELLLCSVRLMALIESYQPARQPKAYDMRGLGPVFQHISTVLGVKAARLVDEDQGEDASMHISGIRSCPQGAVHS